MRKIGLKRTAPVTTKAARGDDRLGVYSRRSYLSTAGDLFGLASVMALTLLVIPAIYVAPHDDEETPRTQNKEMKTWFKIGRN